MTHNYRSKGKMTGCQRRARLKEILYYREQRKAFRDYERVRMMLDHDDRCDRGLYLYLKQLEQNAYFNLLLLFIKHPDEREAIKRQVNDRWPLRYRFEKY